MISRLTAQKGFDLVEKIFADLMQRDLAIRPARQRRAAIEEFFRGAAASYPDRVAVRIGFDEPLAHQIEAGADLFLMPSLYEPCGLNQMYSLKYATTADRPGRRRAERFRARLRPAEPNRHGICFYRLRWRRHARRHRSRFIRLQR